jgi:phosphate transport system permease protein
LKEILPYGEKQKKKYFKALMILATLAITGSLFLIIIAIVRRGLPVMSWEMIPKFPAGGFYLGKEGGLLNAIVGSVYMVLGSLFLGLLSVCRSSCSLTCICLKNPGWHRSHVSPLIVLFGIPSIVYGHLGFTLMVYLGLRSSSAGRDLTVTMLIIPILIRSIDEVIRRVPKDMKDAALSLGATRSETIRVVLRQVAPGIVTAILLAASDAG